ncbi:MAG: putative quinol monooxygenase [Phycisphaerales bacterium]
MAEHLTIVARIEAEPAHVDFVRAELVKLIAPTLAEDGCVQYDLHQDNDEPAVFLFYENWTTRELWQDHMNSPHLAAFGAAVDGRVKSIVINEMARVQ